MTDQATRLIRLDELIAPAENQIRAKLCKKTAKRYADAMSLGAEFPAIQVVLVNNAPVLVDGFHRVAAAKHAGVSALLAVVQEAKTNELRWLAAEANLRHGLPLRPRERREAFKAYVRAGRWRKEDRSIKSSREMAGELQGMCSHQTILNWMRKDFRHVWELMTRSEEDPRHDGGEADPPTEDDFMRAETLSLLRQAKVAMRGIADPILRGEMIAEAEMTLDEMRHCRPYDPHEPEF